MPSDTSTSGTYRVFCAYPRSCGAETHVDSEYEAEQLVEFHEEAHEGQHSADYEKWSADSETQQTGGADDAE